MKMNKKVIGILVASVGVLGSIGGAVALYTQAADNVNFGITAGAYAGLSGTVDYKVNNNAGASNVAPSYLNTAGNDDSGVALSAQYTQVRYEMALSATYTDGNPQNYVVGNLSVSITNIPAAYQGKLSIWVDIDGYVADSLGKNTYEHVFMNSDYAITNENASYTASRDVAVAANGSQKLRIFLKYDFGELDTLEKNEASLGYTLSVTWGAPSNEFVPAYIKGDGNQWEEDDGYAMLPNINKTTEGWEWIYNNLPGTIGETKCFIHDGSDKWSAANYEADPAKSYNVTWSGVADAAANYQEIA